ncbi:MAG: NAD(P)H-hydrate dehydratase [Deltaproteobacteria bacterium RIFCSPLOWO2_12_FULL_44_12]|nr:MAG: NAD(P)H-hydrate dehydratase [Deltaproteobacteria bacterium RIFCSPHIGHO2_01_FULL_43_49]OGQ14247.1 MAG: NAD(P)H-hydrate dehydratase [Deltaproteobacteria bacterium RIFCSPHIGHO2_02_FULL_44_53]OGQ27463.1 MAG: NAD(P)H-hydrate dehydratase [Deltaproteobacteria bacterium RIFCSPHIGHO2_12_FULL_44_21]OGQ30711.1 MAG: NAD(P)H-hydrate dehydratase [Deltaproteobacteria bacterium RIFCSPLOWO2_01_FULL_45_74]OGQ42388.1 MAG: NAD(P)H-hydrate dehydratase [Deltaproteobacteria bacterium RIFCSPLOWO2_02_FULL_44_34
MQLVNSQQARQLDQLSEQLGVATKQLMENAGKAVAQILMRQTKPTDGYVVFFIGKGNNGGDGLVAQKHLREKGYTTLLIKEGDDLKPHTATLRKASWIVDGLLGTGLKGEVRGWTKEAIDCINNSGKKVLSIDIPSGLSADKGYPLGVAVKATLTVSLGNVKLGVVLYPGCDTAGQIECADIGIPKKAYEKLNLPYHLLEPSYFKSHFKPRPKDVSKKDFGHVLVVGGSKEMPGAGFLASLGALRSGAGLVTYALPQEAFEKFDPNFAEVMVKPIADEKDVLKACEKKEVVLIGPGLGRKKETQKLVQTLLDKIKLPIVLDADGLNAIALNPGILKERKAPTVLTPHVGEMANLFGWQPAEIEKARVQGALDGAAIWKCHLILKGFRTLIALPNGELYVNPTGNPGMASAGMGDLLAGIIAGFLAQGFPADIASLAGVYIHGLAGDMAREELGEKGLIASDVSRYVPQAIKLVEKVN